MRLLIVTPTLGSSPFLSATRDSLDVVRKRPEWRLEHVVVCPARKVAEVSALCPAARVIAETGRGLYSAINDGLVSARGRFDFWTYLNDDDCLAPDFVHVLDHTGPGCIVYGTVMLLDVHGRELGRISRLPYGRWMQAALADKRSPLNQQGAVLPASTLEQVGYFNPKYKYAGDYDYLCRCARILRFVYVDRIVAGFRVTPGQLSEDSRPFEAEIREIRAVNQVNRMYRTVGNCLFLVGNLGLYIERIFRRRKFGSSVFK